MFDVDYKNKQTVGGAEGLEMFVPSGDIVWRSSVLVHGILVEVAGVEVGLDGGKDGYLQCSLAEACGDRKC